MRSPKIPPISALTALEPRPDGQWAVNGHDGDSTSLSYVMDNGAEAITYTLRHCHNEDDIRKHCASFVYEYNDNVSEIEYHHQNVHEVPTEFRDTQGAASILYQSQEESALRPYSTGQIQQPLQEHLLFNTEATIVSPSESQAQASIQFEETTLAPQSHFYQHGQRLNMPNHQQLSQNSFAPETTEWPLSNELFPTAVGNASISIPNTEFGLPQDTPMFLSAWQQNWAHVTPNTTQGSDGDWDTFFSQHS
ncbi:hypothetical protein T069G_01640 [Trichoderma breve]|uniref:Uncharacterized protein n=1 Tax=Trichoderma breve TaxID=2034170 RepID=A0A9W9JS80_9HYPO|nr:hypothetical protein T069G_01640 [Trichoderma breve]KAJ4865110.1 hypothetical protein T069G_01640 [Trichoderma breve]